ncbi:MAG: DUF4417 domain-containing protein [Caulobacteraceae bacterium]|nr:DUF4417 domain-containing protein [Caulobacteraceae bacterium]
MRTDPWTVMDWLWPSDNEYHIPLLAPADDYGVDLPVVAWGSIGRSRSMPGTFQFYVDDYRFDRLWKAPHAPIDTGCKSLVEPNVSLFDQTPRAAAIWAVYRKRWLARYWQSRCRRVWVDLNVPAAFQSLNLLGVPAGWKHFATRGYDRRLHSLDNEYHVARNHNGNATLLVIGGGSSVAEWCRAHEQVTHVPYADTRQAYSKAHA